MSEQKANKGLVIVIVILGLIVVTQGIFLLYLNKRNANVEIALGLRKAKDTSLPKEMSAYRKPAAGRSRAAGARATEERRLAELARLQAELDGLLSGLPGPSMPPAPPRPVISPTRSSLALAPNVDFDETEGELIIKFDMPGLEKDKIKVQVQNGILTVSGERREEATEGAEGEGNFFSEVQYGSYSRSVSLPPTVDASRVEAKYENGVLRVIFPKKEGSEKPPTPVAVS